LDPLYINIEVGRAETIPKIGLLNNNLPALRLNKIIKKEGIITLTTVLIAIDQPTL
tara:strand:+ start:345 stop:512 length:168 start_codon:yes stop_codon:yes gene_type:complete